MAVETNGPRNRVGRPTRAESARIRARLRDAAVDAFMAQGFEATTMESVARAAGVTKRTLYSHYPDKETLFGSVIPWAVARRYRDEPEPAPDPDDLAAGLAAIARSAVARAVDPDVVRLTRLAMDESPRFPEFATSAHSLTFSPRMRAVMDLLDRHRATGAVVVDDVELAAEQFLAMVSLMPARLAAFGIVRAPDVEERHIQHAVQLFLRGVATR